MSAPSRQPTNAVVVGIDLGTSAVKVLAVDGRRPRDRVAVREFYGLETPHPDFVEQDADVVYRATMRVLERVLADVRLRGIEVGAIGLSSAMHGVLCVDDAGEPLSGVITWLDRRAHAIADAWRADGTAASLYAQTGAPMHPMLPIAKLRWLAENDPALFATHAPFRRPQGAADLPLDRRVADRPRARVGDRDVRSADARLAPAGAGSRRRRRRPPLEAGAAVDPLRAFRPAIVSDWACGRTRPSCWRRPTGRWRTSGSARPAAAISR